MKQVGKEPSEPGGKRHLFVVTIVIAIVLVGASFFVGYAFGLKEYPESVRGLAARTCLAEVSLDTGYCTGPELTMNEESLCAQSVYHTDFFFNGNKAALSRITLLKDEAVAISEDDIKGCKGNIVCEVVISNDKAGCYNDPSCLDLFHKVNAFMKKDISYCSEIREDSARIECLAVLSGKPKLCFDIK